MTPDCTITARSSAEIIAVTPYVIGFHPADSVVVIGVVGRTVAFGCATTCHRPTTTAFPTSRR